MAHYVSNPPNSNPVVLPVATTVFQPYMIQCKVISIFPRDQNWTEFDGICQYPTVQNVSGNFVFGAKDNNTCTYLVGNANGNVSIVVGNGTTQTTGSMTKWGCNCAGPCSWSTWNNISACVVNFTQSVAPVMSFDDDSGSTNSPLARIPHGEFDGIMRMVLWCMGIALAIGAVVFCCWCGCGCCKLGKKNTLKLEEIELKSNKFK